MPALDYQALFDSAPSLFLILDPTFHIVAANDAFLRGTRSNRCNIIGRLVFDAFPDPPDSHANAVFNLRTSLERVLENKAPDTMAVQRYDVPLPPELGSGSEVRYWSAVNSPILDPAGNVVNIVHWVEDVTLYVRLALDSDIDLSLADPKDLFRNIKHLIDGHKRLELEFRQAQKMEAIGRLAGGIAHDFNNLLTVILGYCKVLLGRTAPNDLAHRQLNDIRIAGERAAELTRHLLAFSRKQVLEPHTVNLADTLEEMDRLLRRVIGADIEVATLINRDAGMVKVDPTQIQQVLMNLVVNARDAMPNGGKLTIELRNQTVPEGVDSRFAVPPGDYVVLAVTDTGVGMPSEIKQRAFEPFFTTKDPGRGTGLGLSTVYGIIKQSGGYLWLFSEPGAGTSFRIFLPHVPDAHEVFSAVSYNTSRLTGSETILVVEDDHLIRTLIHEILGEAGYNVMGATHGDEALFICQQVEGPIHLLLTDLVLPRINGKEIAAQVRTLRPDTRILYMSGFTGDSIEHGEIFAHPQVEFIQKPFTPELLCHRVRAALDS